MLHVLYTSYAIVYTLLYLTLHNILYTIGKCYIMNGNPRSAWEVYLKTTSSNESFHLLQMIANDCFKVYYICGVVYIVLFA